MRNVGKFAAVTAIAIAWASVSHAAQSSDNDAVAQTKELNVLQNLDRQMLDARGKPEFQANHDAFGDEMLKLSKGPNVRVIPDNDDSAILARMQSLGRQLGANTRGSDVYNEVHAEFEVLIKTLGRRDSIADPR